MQSVYWFLLYHTCVADHYIVSMLMVLFPDGRKPFPINHGPTTPDTFLQVLESNLIPRTLVASFP